MSNNATANLINLLGFITGAALYAMLLMMFLRTQPIKQTVGSQRSTRSANHLLLLAAILGLAWNIGAFAVFGLVDLGIDKNAPLLTAAAFCMLGFLPALVVHSVLRAGKGLDWHKSAFWITASAYALSTVAGLMHFYVAATTRTAPSHIALHILTIGFGLLIGALFLLTRGQAGWRKAIWAIALAVFAVSAQHLSHHEGNYPWWMELAGHHASIPLALAILYQDYRFAFADIFLKRALSLLLLIGMTFAIYIMLFTHLIAMRDASGNIDPRAVGLILAMWITTALLYPTLRRYVTWFVDAIVLRRVNYDELRAEIARAIAIKESPESILNEVCVRLSPALTAREARWLESNEIKETVVNQPDSTLLAALIKRSQAIEDNENLQQLRHITTALPVPTTETPHYVIIIGELAGGRWLLSDDIAMLEAVALLAARRIDAVRVVHNRCQMSLREQEISKLATEAELRALRAQINPHFLFNALTTIGYLIQVAPERALETLLRLTGLLRGVLKRSEGDFTTLGEEIDLIKSYLDIEKTRFEERLQVSIDLPADLNKIRVPSFLLQPLVENAVKHGISRCNAGGAVFVSGRLESADKQNQNREMLFVSVRDTGAGASELELARGRKRGVGLANIERRLKCHYGDAASINIKSDAGVGTVVEIRLPIHLANILSNEDRSEWMRNYVS
jgi:two-component system LytT family sensor kinase